jgi:hypothetical protein
MNSEFDLQQRFLLRHAELVREATNQRLADQLASSTPGARKRMAALLYALATRLDTSLPARQGSPTFGAATASGGRCDVAPGLF